MGGQPGAAEVEVAAAGTIVAEGGIPFSGASAMSLLTRATSSTVLALALTFSGGHALAAQAAPSAPTAKHHSALKGAVVGAAAGHVLGHHAVAGGVVGAMVQHHRNKKAAKAAKSAGH